MEAIRTEPNEAINIPLKIFPTDIYIYTSQVSPLDQVSLVRFALIANGSIVSPDVRIPCAEFGRAFTVRFPPRTQWKTGNLLR